MTGAASFHHLFMLVSNLMRSRVFYTQVLGFRVLMEEDGYIQVGSPEGFHIGMEQGNPNQIGGQGIEINIAVDNVDHWYVALQEQGVVFVAPPADTTWGARHAFFADPDGYRLSIFTPSK
jgi:catechol 2,3-dioxygenase-like lactoylglutathione lyase family enzyme